MSKNFIQWKCKQKIHQNTKETEYIHIFRVLKVYFFISRTNILHFLSTVLLNTKISGKMLILVNGKFQNSFNKKVLRSIRSIKSYSDLNKISSTLIFHSCGGFL